MTFRLQANDRNMGMGADVAFAVFMVDIHRCHIQILCDPEEVPGIQQNILPVDAALAAGSTVKAEGVIQTDGHGLQVLGNVL